VSRRALLLLLLAAWCVSTAASTSGRPGFDSATRVAVIEEVLADLNSAYVFPDVAAAMERAVRERMNAKEYDAITSPSAFAKKLTADLQAVSKDKHLRVISPSSPKPGAAQKMHVEDKPDATAGFHRVEKLRGNIGYIDLRGFLPPRIAGEKAAGAMNTLADSDALIFDLRKNGGGSADMVALLISYLVDETPVHLNDFVGRDGNVTESYHTLAEVPGRRYGPKDVYVVTSNYTFSAAEEFCYNLKNLGRATLVGETTGGGANPIDWFELPAGFRASIPTARARSPITQTNWEGTGVTPHIEVPAKAALKTAHLAALKKLLASGMTGDRAAALERAIAQVEKEN
jgi:retinol-binding protein 3